MKIEWRKRIAQIGPVHHLARIIMYNSGWFFYRKKYNALGYKELFARLKGSKAGKRCFIIGNGPSLRSEDLELLKSEDCFAANGIYNIFPKTDWRPKYYLIMDRYFSADPNIIADMECENVFLGDYYWRYNTVKRQDAICLHQHVSLNWKHYPISRDISKQVVISGTVSFVAMQIAAYLGYHEIYLLGFDHNYNLEFDSGGKLIHTDVSSHFYTDSVPEEVIVFLSSMTTSYCDFRDFAEKEEIVIKNATRGGKLEVFERVDFDSLFDRSEN